MFGTMSSIMVSALADIHLKLSIYSFYCNKCNLMTCDEVLIHSSDRIEALLRLRSVD